MNGRVGSTLPALVFVALMATTSVATADEAAGRTFTRQAQQALADGDPVRAIELIEQARIEWPGAPVIAHTLADARYRQGDYASAMIEYDKGSGGVLAFRAFFNQGVTLNALAEEKLGEAGVPLDPAGIPADVVPGPMIEAIDKGLKTLELSRGHFLDALADSADAEPGEPSAARESVAAINRRMDDLREMKEELEKLREEQEEQEDSEDGEDEQESEDDEGEQNEDGEQDQDQEQEGENQDGERNPDEQSGEGDEPQEPTEPQEAEPVPGQQTQLNPQQMAQLLEQLEELEERARAMQRVRRAQQRKAVDRDW